MPLALPQSFTIYWFARRYFRITLKQPHVLSRTWALNLTESQADMKIKLKAIEPATKPHRLADAVIQLSDSEGESITISDVRILQNRQGQAWMAMPSRSVSTGGRSFSYLPQVEVNKALLRRIEEAVLNAYEQWRQSNSQAEVLA